MREKTITNEEREALGRAAHAGAPQHCQFGHLYPKVREAYRVQGVKVAMVATEMCAKIAEGYASADPDSVDAAKAIAATIREHFAEADEDEAIGFCEDCGKPVRVDDPGYKLDMESDVYICAACAQKWSGGPRRTSPDHGAVTEPGSAADPR